MLADYHWPLTIRNDVMRRQVVSRIMRLQKDLETENFKHSSAAELTQIIEMLTEDVRQYDENLRIDQAEVGRLRLGWEGQLRYNQPHKEN